MPVNVRIMRNLLFLFRWKNLGSLYGKDFSTSGNENRFNQLADLSMVDQISITISAILLCLHNVNICKI